MNRSEFLDTCLRRCAGAIGVAWVNSACSNYYYYAQSTVTHDGITFQKQEFSAERNGRMYLRPFVLVKTEDLEFPICVYRIDDDNFIALYTRCMHQGCEVKPQDDYLVCPCHGSEYDNTGKVVHPPAERDLLRFRVTTDRDAVYITISS